MDYDRISGLALATGLHEDTVTDLLSKGWEYEDIQGIPPVWNHPMNRLTT